MFVIVLDYELRKAIEGHDECLGLTIKPRQRCNVKAEKVTDLNFADRIALFSHQFQQAQELLRNVEEASAKVVLLPNAKKTKYVFCNHHVDAGLETRDDEVIEPVENFKCLGSWISNSEHDFKDRKASAWIAYNKMRKVWTSKLS